MDDLPPAPPVEVKELPVGIPDIALVSAGATQLDRIPNAALAAYQRAAGVLDGADKECHLEWTLVAAVGQVVTGHGTTDGGRFDRHGVLRPKLTGKALRGRDGKRVPDSDAGRLDGDGRYDRPAGPMLLSRRDLGSRRCRQRRQRQAQPARHRRRRTRGLGAAVLRRR